MSYKTFAVDIDGTITENGGGRIDLNALTALRNLKKIGHNVVLVSGRSSIEGYLLSVFGGLTKIAVGENGAVLRMDLMIINYLGTKMNANLHSNIYKLNLIM